MSIGVFALVVILISGMLATGMRGVLLGKRREVASHEATRVLETARSLSYDEIGLSPDDPTIDTDERIQTVNGIKQYLVDEAAGSYEPIIWATNTQNHPFNPHTTTVKRGSTTLTNYVYVTGVDTTGDGVFDLKRILTRVEWDDSGTQGPANEVRAQTYVDEGGLVPVVHSSPMSAQTLASVGTASVRSDRGDPANLVDAAALPLDPVIASLPTSSGETTSRAVSSVGCTAQSAYLQGATNTYGQHSVAASADDDALTATPEQQSQSWSGNDAVNGNDDVDALVVETSVSNDLACRADVSDDDGAAPTDDGLPYQKGTSTGPNTVTMTEDLSGADLTSTTLTVLALTSQSAAQEIDHATVSGAREIGATSEGSVGDIAVLRTAGALPDGLVKVNGFGFSASATASEGTPSSAPSVQVPGGITVKVYDPNGAIPTGTCTSRADGYCTVTFDPTAPGFSGLSVKVDDSVTKNLGLTILHYSIDVRAFPPATTNEQIDPQTGARRWSAEYRALSVSARLRVEVLESGSPVILTDSIVDLSLGTVSATGCSGVGCA